MAEAGRNTNSSTLAAPVPTTIVSGGNARLREQAIFDAIHATQATVPSAVLLEGLPDGEPLLREEDGVNLSRTVAGCLCCSGNMVMRVNLNRLLRTRPRKLFVSVASAAHLDALRSILKAPPYDQLLCLEQEIALN